MQGTFVWESGGSDEESLHRKWHMSYCLSVSLSVALSGECTFPVANRKPPCGEEVPRVEVGRVAIPGKMVGGEKWLLSEGPREVRMCPAALRPMLLARRMVETK